MIVVLDTNVLVQARAIGHAYHCMLQAWLSGKLTLAVSAEIMLEYEEIITTLSGAARWQVLEQLLLASSHLLMLAPDFHYQIVTADPDDNKFADCAISAHADFLMTEDADFAPLSNAGYKPQPIKPAEFIPRFLSKP